MAPAAGSGIGVTYNNCTGVRIKFYYSVIDMTDDSHGGLDDIRRNTFELSDFLNNWIVIHDNIQNGRFRICFVCLL